MINKKSKLTLDGQKEIFWHNSTKEQADVVLFGMPYDKTASYRKGTTEAFNSIRDEAEAIELYSPILDCSLEEFKIHDAGDLKIQNQKPEEVVNSIYNYVKKEFVANNKFFIGIGGEHSVTLGEVKALLEKYPDLHILHLDAHTDLRDEFQGHKYSHANVIRRIYDLVGPNKIYSFGIRSGSKEEFDFYKTGKIYCEQSSVDTVAKIVKKLKNKPVFITIDIDVLDPSIMTGTGTAEPGGVTFKELANAIYSFSKLNNLVGADLVELSPMWDPYLTSTSVAVKILRELTLTILKSKMLKNGKK